MLLDPLPPVTNCHTFLDPLPLERDVLYGRPPLDYGDTPMTNTMDPNISPKAILLTPTNIGSTIYAHYTLFQFKTENNVNLRLALPFPEVPIHLQCQFKAWIKEEADGNRL